MVEHILLNQIYNITIKPQRYIYIYYIYKNKDVIYILIHFLCHSDITYEYRSHIFWLLWLHIPQTFLIYIVAFSLPSKSQ